MTICFKNCDFKYETESVTKLFLPFERFKFLYDDENTPEGDHIIMSAGSGSFSLKVSLNGISLCSEIPDSGEKGKNETALCRELFKFLSKITGIVPKWGCLTGIRPVRKVKPLLDKGLSDEHIISMLGEEYFLSREKAELALDICKNQKQAMDRLRENSFSLYINIPFCPTRCAYCSFVSCSVKEAGAELIPAYTEKLCRELEITAEAADKMGLSLDTIYVGGGTPTAIPAENLKKILEKAAECFNLSGAAEYTVEAGRADTITEEKLSVIKAAGAKRISVNPQSMSDKVLEAIGRKHTAAEVRESFLLARKMGFENINMDVIAGLPADTPESFKRTLEEVAELDPESVTVHTLTLKRSADLFNRSEEIKRTVSAEETDEMVTCGRKFLTERGYSPYYLYRQKNTVGNLENTGYSKKGCECLYNIYIMDESQTIFAAGAGSSTKLVYPNSGLIERVMDRKYPFEYIRDFDAIMERKKKAFRKFAER